MQMTLVNIVASLIIIFLVGSACLYIYSEKKKGTRCIGCPMAGKCKKVSIKTDCAASPVK